MMLGLELLNTNTFKFDRNFCPKSGKSWIKFEQNFNILLSPAFVIENKAKPYCMRNQCLLTRPTVGDCNMTACILHCDTIAADAEECISQMHQCTDCTKMHQCTKMRHLSRQSIALHHKVSKCN